MESPKSRKLELPFGAGIGPPRCLMEMFVSQPSLRVVQSDVPSKAARFFAEEQLPSPCLVLDLDIVRQRYSSLCQSLPGTKVCYAVKANPEPEVLAVLASLGSGFDVASVAEIEMCLAAGAEPARLSYSNTVKKADDIAWAYAHGIRLFAFDSQEELEKIARTAPGAEVMCRLLTDNTGAQVPLSRKFGCDTVMARDLMLEAVGLGLLPVGLCFHVGSQQTHLAGWDTAIAQVAALAADLEGAGLKLKFLNLGGGFPGQYQDQIPPLQAYAKAIRSSLEMHFGPNIPQTVIEPGRFIVADAGVLQSEVILVSRKSYDDPFRWVYLDVGRFGGLAETEGEAIKYRIETDKDGGVNGPVIIAGPTCDSVDILYEKSGYELPMDLEAGDKVYFRSAGAYTSCYATKAFNGFAPFKTYFI